MGHRKPLRLPHEQYGDPSRLFHVVARSHPAVPAWDERIRGAVWNELMAQASSERLRLVAACLMTNHVHLLASPGNIDLLRWLNEWKSFTTRRAWETGHQGPLWQPSFWDRAVREGAALDTVKYVVQNPVAAGLVRDWREWPWTYLAPERVWPQLSA